jgi:hypothetical protein
MNETKLSELRPDQLLEALDLQLRMQRAKRRQSARSRTAIRVGGILLILGSALAGVLILQYVLSEFPRGEQGGRQLMENGPRQTRNF